MMKINTTFLGRLIFIAYGLLLTSLLLLPNPIGFYHLNSVLSQVPERGVHFSFFAMLAILACACRFRVHWLILVIVLIAYGLTIESLQYFAPPRQVEFLDYVENVLGVLVGCLLWWIGRRLVTRKSGWHSPPGE